MVVIRFGVYGSGNLYMVLCMCFNSLVGFITFFEDVNSRVLKIWLTTCLNFNLPLIYKNVKLSPSNSVLCQRATYITRSYIYYNLLGLMFYFIYFISSRYLFYLFWSYC